jgi:pyridoxal phosphate enzyme (YggS family)
MTTDEQRIGDNYRRIVGRVAEAAERCGRSADEVTVVAVTKYVTSELMRPLLAVGCRDFGESRPQQLWQKAAELAEFDDIRWHMIGHLQRNKVARTVTHAGLIHSVDSDRLLAAIDTAAAPEVQDVLLEVNVSGEAAKHGYQAAEIAGVLAGRQEHGHLRIVGLMGMAALVGGAAAARANFRALRELRDSLVEETGLTDCLQHLSMGMSGDYAIAIEEGATIVRVGSALFAVDDA